MKLARIRNRQKLNEQGFQFLNFAQRRCPTDRIRLDQGVSSANSTNVNEEIRHGSLSPQGDSHETCCNDDAELLAGESAKRRRDLLQRSRWLDDDCVRLLTRQQAFRPALTNGGLRGNQQRMGQLHHHISDSESPSSHFDDDSFSPSGMKRRRMDHPYADTSQDREQDSTVRERCGSQRSQAGLPELAKALPLPLPNAKEGEGIRTNTRHATVMTNDTSAATGIETPFEHSLKGLFTGRR